MSSSDPLSTHRRKRDFRRTPEPSGGRSGLSEKPLFVIQKHDASSLHYDFRPEGDEADARRIPVSTEPTSVLSGRTLEQIAEK